MKIFRILSLILASTLCTHAFASDDNSLNFIKIDPQLINYQLQENQNDDWIKTNSSTPNKLFSLSTKQINTFRDEVELAWNFSNLFSINVNLFEDNNYTNYFASPSLAVNTRSPNKSASRSFIPTLDVNTRLTGYKIGLSSDFGIGRELKLGINVDYGTLNGADLVGFSSENINTSSFALGIRNNKFGASVITDGIIENNTFLTDQARMGFEIDWHFSENTTFSFGTKKQINTNNPSSQKTTLDNLSGNIQYIKFQHNL